MRRSKMMGIALVAVLAAGAMTAGTATARKPVLEMDYFKEAAPRGYALLPVGEQFQTSFTQVTIRSDFGTVTCFGTLKGSLLTNKGKSDTLTLTEATGQLNDEEECAPASPRVLVSLEFFPWSLKVGVAGKATLKGNTGPIFLVALPSVVSDGSAAAFPVCFYKDEVNIEGLENTTGHESPLFVTMPQTEMLEWEHKQNRHPDPGCPSSIVVTINFGGFFGLQNGLIYANESGSHF